MADVPGSASHVRKTVTSIFADLVGSSRLSLALDPEALRILLARYFDEQSAIVRRHGGTVEKYIGDSIMAVFGVPTLHEDDALRAVRAAVEMRSALGDLNRELEANWGIRLASRIGINTGEVIAADHAEGHLFVTGDAVTVAKRLEEAAEPNEILVAEATYRLVRHAVVVEPTGPRALGFGQSVDAFTVMSVLPDAPGLARHFGAPFVGRADERAELDAVFAAVVRDRACHLLTVVGPAGIGKSRLVREFTQGLPGATVLRGRCLPYGEGITYWPLTEMIREMTRAGGAEADGPATEIAARLAGDEKAGLIAGRVAEALGFGRAGGGSSEEIFWAIRRLFEALARAGPLVIVVDDLHWAEATFLDLIEHVTDHSRDGPILLICIARPELLEKHPAWGASRPNATRILLEPLSDAECRELVSNMLGGAPLPVAAEARITDAAGGNALFAEELVAMLVDERLITREPDRWIAASDLAELPVPPTINALLAARVESLPPVERAILGAAAVEGEVFHRGAVRALARPVPEAFDDGVEALVRRELILPGAADFAGQDAFRFRHILLRDAAYRLLPKGARSDLHERLAGWIETAAGDRLREFDEIVGYHLERAHQNRVALGLRDAHAAALAARACDRLEAAGRRALVRMDLPAAIGLLERVCRLLATDDPRRIALLAELGAAMIEAGRLAEAGRVLDEAERLAAMADDARLASHALVQRQFLRLFLGEGVEEAAAAAARVIPVLERLGDDMGLCHARRLEAWVNFNEWRAEAAAAACERAAGHARRAGDRHGYHEVLTRTASLLWFGPTPAAEAITRCEALRAEVRESPKSEAAILRQIACLHAIVGRFARARELIAASNATYADLGLTLFKAGSQHETYVELLAGNPAGAEKSARAAYRALEAMGERSYRSTTAANLALVLLELGRDEEAEALAEVSAQLGAKDDLATQVRWRRARARVLARRGETRAAEALAREALAIADTTDFLNDRAAALTDLSHVLEASRRWDDAVAVAKGAMKLYDLKGNLVAAAATRLRIGEIVKM